MPWTFDSPDQAARWVDTDWNRAIYGVANPGAYVCAADRIDESTNTGGRWTLTFTFDMDEDFDDEMFVQLNSSLVVEQVKGWAKDVVARLVDNRASD